MTTLENILYVVDGKSENYFFFKSLWPLSMDGVQTPQG